MKQFYQRLSLVPVLLFLGISAALAQRTLTGTVKDGTGGALPGVNILIKGSTAGTITDANGSFSIQASESDVLVISFIGFETKEVSVGSQTNIAVVMKEDVTSLQEVVVVGYGTQDKKVVTGATVVVKGEDLVKTNSGQIAQALQGQTPGVQITSTSGQPGEPLKVTIRGMGTVGDASPLYIVDGMTSYDISNLNAASIERIDVLKDAASTAIYGARAANGVILITTKKGKEGSIQVSYDSYIGVQNLYRKIPMLNSREYTSIMNEGAVNSGLLLPYTQTQINAYAKGDASHPSTDWQKQAFGTNVPMQNHSLTVSGGNDKSIFSSTLSYFKQGGILGGNQSLSSFDRLTFSVNSQHKVYKDIVKFGENFSYALNDKSGIQVGGIYNNAVRPFLNAIPIYPVYANAQFPANSGDTDKIYAASPQTNDTNPMGLLHYTNLNGSATDRIFGNIFAEVQVIKGLTFRTDFGVDLNLNNSRQFNPMYALSSSSYNNPSSVTQSSNRSLRWNWDNTIRYSKTFGDHNIEVLVGTTSQLLDNTSMSATKKGLLFNDYNNAYLDNGTIDTTVTANGNRTRYALRSYFARANYNYKGKYILSAIVRRDGSSNFGPNNLYGTFPSVSAGWVASEENFFKSLSSKVNFLKLRAGWGQNGNDRILPFAYLATLTPQNRSYYFGSSDAKAVGLAPATIANPNIKWETSEQTNIGLDATVMDNITLSVDWYNKVTKDWLVQAPTPLIAGTETPPYINGGTIQNRGIEIQVGYKRQIGALSFGVNGNVAFNKNTVTQINNPEGIIHGATNVLFQGLDEMYRAQVGHPLGYFYGYKVAGVFQNTEQVNAYSKNGVLIQPSAQPGDVKFADVNGDGVINALDKVQIGNPNPKATYGLTFNFGYKGFDLSIYTYGMAGQQVAQGIRSNERAIFNYTTDILNRWHGEGTSNFIPRVLLGNDANQNYSRFSQLYIHDASFYRIKTITLGYDFKTLLKNIPLKQLRLYFSVNNLFTFTKYKGYDPEVGYGAVGTSGNTDLWSSGVDVGFYPQPRTVITGISVKF